MGHVHTNKPLQDLEPAKDCLSQQRSVNNMRPIPHYEAEPQNNSIYQTIMDSEQCFEERFGHAELWKSFEIKVIFRKIFATKNTCHNISNIQFLKAFKIIHDLKNKCEREHPLRSWICCKVTWQK